MKDLIYDTDQLDTPEIRKTIRSSFADNPYKPSEELINEIIHQLWFLDTYNSLISYRVFLNHLIEYLKSTKSSLFSRPDFYRFLFSSLISSSFSEKDQKHATHILQQIGVFFEQRQSAEVEINDYTEFLSKIDTPKDWFLPQWFVTNEIGKIESREKKKFLILQHHTLSETLAASFIQEQQATIKTLESHVVFREGNFEAIIPSWFGTLRFLLEDEKNETILSWILNWITKHPEDINESLSDILCNLHRPVSEINQNRIFDLIYETYFDRAVWLSVWTRTGLGKYVDKERYLLLKSDLETGANETEKMVHTGNIVAIVHGMLETQHELLSPEEKKYWKKQFIEYANRDSSENGVLQRHSLHALTCFHDEDIIPLVARNFDSHDSLVRDAFIDFCIETDPNSKKTIDYLIKGVVEDKTVYARLGIDKITDKEALHYFLDQIASNKQFLKEYTEYRTIFDKEPDEPHLIANLKSIIDKDTAHYIWKVLIAILEHEEIYEMRHSGLLKELIILINDIDSNILFDILEYVATLPDTRQNRVFGEIRSILAGLITTENWREYVEIAKPLSSPQKYGPICDLYNSDKDKIYRQAVKEKIIKPLKRQPPWEKEQKDQEKRIYKEFYEQLNRGENRYDPNVFQYYQENKKLLKRYWKKADKQRLIDLADNEGIERINPREFRVEILGDKDSSREFSWSAPAAYFGHIIEIVQEYNPKLLKKKLQKVVDYIPFSFSHDIFPLLEKILSPRDHIDFTFVNEIMADQSKDIRYLIPSTYIYFVSDMAQKGFVIEGAKDILLSFIRDERIKSDDRRSALEKLELFITNQDEDIKHQLQSIAQAVDSQNDDLKQLAYIANALLITVYKDEAAIEWRFKKIKEPIAFVRQEGGHSPSSDELEIDFMHFAKPLIELKDMRYLHRFLGLLQQSIDLAPDAHQNDLWDYIQYLWRIVFSYAEGLVEQHSMKPYHAIKSFVDVFPNTKNSNWLLTRLNELRSYYVTIITRDIDIAVGRNQVISLPSNELEPILLTKQQTLTQSQNPDYRRKRAKIIHRENKYKLFISHATRGRHIDENELEFTKIISNLFEKIFPEKVYVDFNNRTDIHETHLALSSSEYGLSICTARYIERYISKPPLGIDSVVTTEVENFDRKIRKNSEYVVAIALNITRNEVEDSIAPFANKIYIHEAPYEALISIEDLAINAFNDIKVKIK